ncbi:MAG: ribonuclease E/G, partial [Bdellovibrionaceae bacterium]|nr:ribonuclease E/G [Pseudobdellovibrionaceae bacterium]
MSRHILINVRPWETRVACVDHGALVDLVIEQKSSPTFVGSVYKGRVIKVLPGMQAAFVDIGLEKAGFLYVRDILPYWQDDEVDEFGEEREPWALETSQLPNIQELIHEGQYILTQVAKDPIGTKGPRLTMNLALPGRYVVYMPTVRHIGISRKIQDDKERERLRNIISQSVMNAGVIIRTAAEGASVEDLQGDLTYLERTYQEIIRHYEKKR